MARLVDRVMERGRHSFVWSGRDRTGRPLASGIYYARLQAAAGTAIRKILLVR